MPTTIATTHCGNEKCIEQTVAPNQAKIKLQSQVMCYTNRDYYREIKSDRCSEDRKALC